MKMQSIWAIVVVLLSGFPGLLACASDGPPQEVDFWGVRVIAAYPHDENAFTQGLIVYRGKMYEGTGRYGASSLRRVDIPTGKAEQVVPLDKAYFGEGITVFEDRLYQLTWQNNIVLLYDVRTMALLKTMRYDREAWGLTNDGTYLIVSDGTPVIRFLDPATLKQVRYLTVHMGDRLVGRLNELEYVENEIWANIWYEDRIARISPIDGKILGWIDLGELYSREVRGREDVLNGIAFDAVSGRIYVTGKNWPRLYEIEAARP